METVPTRNVSGAALPAACAESATLEPIAIAGPIADSENPIPSQRPRFRRKSLIAQLSSRLAAASHVQI
jgi:hypothetical protein